MSAPDVQLRRALPEDAPAIAAIWHLGWRDGHLGHVPAELTAARRADSFRIRVAQRIGDTTVAVIGGQVAGFTTVVGGEVEQVYVDAGPFDYAAAGDHGPIPVPSHRYVKEL